MPAIAWLRRNPLEASWAVFAAANYAAMIAWPSWETIARGHLELLRRAQTRSPELSIALDELGRIERIIERLLLLAKADQPDFLIAADVELEPFLEDVFVRWSEVAPRSWRLGGLAVGTLRADSETLRNALDALLENAVKYSRPGDPI